MKGLQQQKKKRKRKGSPKENDGLKRRNDCTKSKRNYVLKGRLV